MTVLRADDVILLEGVCDVEDAELLMRQLQAGASAIDWSGCTHLHAACLQVVLAAGLRLRGTPAGPLLATWVGPILEKNLPTRREPISNPG